MSVSNKGPNVDSRLQNMTNALYLDGNDDVVVRTGFAGNIVISGNVNVPGTIVVDSTPDDPVHTHLSEVGTSGILNVPWLPVSLDGNSNVNANVHGNVTVSGNVNANVSGNVVISSGNVNANVTGSVTVSSLPAITGNVTSVISGNISGITTLPAITGNVTSVISGNISGITTLPAITGNVTSVISGNISGITSLPPITGNVTSTISGNISGITSLPPITGNVTSTISGNISGITSLPAITGNVTSVISGNISGITSLPPITGNVTSVISGNISGITSLPPITGNVTSTLSGNLAGITGNVNVTQGTSPWVVSGNVNANVSGNVGIIGNVTVTPNPNSVTIVRYLDSGTNNQLDATARLRVTTPQQQWWYNPTVDKDGDLRFIESFSGTGATSFYRQNTSMIRLSSGTDSNGSAIRISRRRHKLRPGISMLWTSTFNWDGVQTNVTKRKGQFTAYNGVFFELTTDLSLVIRTRLIDGTLVENRIARTSFNLDKLDGTGSSGININPTATARSGTITGYTSKTSHVISPTETNYTVVFTTSGTVPFVPGDKAHMSGLTPSGYNGSCNIIAVSAGSVTVNYASDPGTFTSGTGTLSNSNLDKLYTWWIDFNGDRTNIVRCGIMTPDGFHICHIEDFTGRFGTHFSNAPAIPSRIEIFNTGVVTSAPTISCGSVSINTEAEAELNPGFGVAQTVNAVAFNKNTNVGDEFAILSIALRAGEPYQRGDLQLQRIQFTDLGNLNPQNAAIFQWRLVLNPTYGGTAVPAEVAIGKCSRLWDYNTGTTISGGINLLGGYIQGTQQMDVMAALNFLNLGSNIDYSDSDRVVLALKMLVGGSSSSSMMATINFNENL